MALLDFSPERRHVELGGRRFTIRRITVGGMVRLLTLFSREIAAMRTMHENEPTVFGTYGTKLALMFLGADERLRAVLRDCVESDVPEAEWPLAELAERVADLTDWPKVIASLEWSETPGDPSDADAENRAIVGVAKLVGVAPTEILDWPFEAWTATVDALGPPKPKGVDPSALAAMMNGPLAFGSGVQ